MNPSIHLRRSFILTVGVLVSWLAAAQDKYVKSAALGGGESSETITNNYYYTERITLTAPTSGTLTYSSAGGNKFMSPIPINPPPSMKENFVRVEVPKTPISGEKALTLTGPDEKSVSYAYSDGLGRSTMSTAVYAGPMAMATLKRLSTTRLMI